MSILEIQQQLQALAQDVVDLEDALEDARADEALLVRVSQLGDHIGDALDVSHNIASGNAPKLEVIRII